MPPKVTDPEIRSAIRESRRLDMVRDIAAGLVSNFYYMQRAADRLETDRQLVEFVAAGAVDIADAVLAHELATRPQPEDPEPAA